MRIAMIDPSLFTLPYDRMLALGLREASHEVALYGRRPRAVDADASGLDLVPTFYRFTEGGPAAWLPSAIRLPLKGLEHVVCMADLCCRLRVNPPDVVHFQWLPLPVADRRFLKRIRAIAPLVLTVHDSMPFNGDPSSGLQRLGVAACFAAFDRLLVHTEQGRARLLAQGVAPSRVVRVPHGLLSTTPTSTAAPPLGGDALKGPLTFLLFGTIKPYKGLDLLIEAFARIPAELRASARLRVVGRPQMDLRPFLALARHHGVAECLTVEPRFVADAEVPKLFGSDTVAVFPYRDIEASGVLSIAIATGRPIVASRVGAFAEILEHRVHGLLVPPEDIVSLGDALARMLSDRVFAARCSAHVRNLAAAMPSWVDIAHRTVEAYDAARDVHRRDLTPPG